MRCSRRWRCARPRSVIRPDMAKYCPGRPRGAPRPCRRCALVGRFRSTRRFLDLSGPSASRHDPSERCWRRFAARSRPIRGITVFRRAVLQQILAKIASDMDKPRRLCRARSGAARAMLAGQAGRIPFRRWTATQERLSQRGFRTIADLQRADEIELMKQFSTEGRRLWRLARGIDVPPLVPDRGARRISARPPSRLTSAILRRLKGCCGASRKRSRRGSRTAILRG